MYGLFLTAFLALDDAFMLHEVVFVYQLHLPEGVFFLLYRGAIIGFFLFYWRRIVRSDFVLLFLALGLFAISMFIDTVPQLAAFLGGDVLFLAEDGSKLAGIICWTTYQLSLGFASVAAEDD